jgi:hypothetical protein
MLLSALCGWSSRSPGRFTSGKEPLTRAGLDGGRKSRLPPGFDSRTVQRLGSRCTDCDISARRGLTFTYSMRAWREWACLLKGKHCILRRKPCDVTVFRQWRLTAYSACLIRRSLGRSVASRCIVSLRLFRGRISLRASLVGCLERGSNLHLTDAAFSRAR